MKGEGPLVDKGRPQFWKRKSKRRELLDEARRRKLKNKMLGRDNTMR